RGQRGHGGVRARLLPGHRRGGPGPARSRVQPVRRAGHHASGRAAGGRDRAVRADDRAALGLGPLRARLPGQCHHRARDPADPHERGGRLAGPRRHGDPGQPRKFSYAITEREDSPWEPLHVALGFKADQSVVTVFGGEGPHNVNDHVSTTAPGILNNVADVATSLGSNVGWYLSQSQILVVLGPEHAATIAADGFTRAGVQRFVFENARMPLGRMKLGGMWGMHDWPTWMAKETDDSVRLPRVPAVDDVYVMVGGGSGKHSCVVPNCTFSRAVSRVLERIP